MLSTETAPIRIQRSRHAGFRLPVDTVYVGRPTRWGNPYKVLKTSDGDGWMVQGNGNTSFGLEKSWTREEAFEYAYLSFKDWFRPNSIQGRDAQIILEGKNLACWCPLDQPCHADILLDIANRKEPMTVKRRVTVW